MKTAMLAMVLAMGAMTSLTASAAGETITVATATGLKEGDKVTLKAEEDKVIIAVK